MRVSSAPSSPLRFYSLLTTGGIRRRHGDREGRRHAAACGDNTFRLDGIDAPAVDQMCIDEHADSWACGVEARDQLAKLVEGKQVRCGDLGPDPACTRSGASAFASSKARPRASASFWSRRAWRSPTQGKVQAGRDGGKGRPPRPLEGLLRRARRFPPLEEGRRADRQLMPAASATSRSAAVLFPADPVMPPGCAIKGKYAVRARVTGNVGIYHLQACRILSRPEQFRTLVLLGG